MKTFKCVGDKRCVGPCFLSVNDDGRDDMPKCCPHLGEADWKEVQAENEANLKLMEKMRNKLEEVHNTLWGFRDISSDASIRKRASELKEEIGILLDEVATNK